MKRVRFTEKAEADVQSAFSWYEQQRENLGASFLDRVDEAVATIARNPESLQLMMPNVRHVSLKKFAAYSLWYTSAHDIVVVGCLHGKRSPAVARKRAKELDVQPRTVKSHADSDPEH